MTTQDPKYCDPDEIYIRCTDHSFFTCFATKKNTFNFKVKGANVRRRICLASIPVLAEADTRHEVVLAPESFIQTVGAGVTTPYKKFNTDIKLDETYASYWVKWENTTVSVGHEGKAEPLVSHTFASPTELGPVKYVGFGSIGGSVSYLLPQRKCQCTQPPDAKVPPIGLPDDSSDNLHWFPCYKGNFPSTAFEAGYNDKNEPLYVSRTKFSIPGQLKQNSKTASIDWNSDLITANSCDVLCDFKGSWVKTTGGEIPAGSLNVGMNEEGIPQYVGRTTHDGSLTIGAVRGKAGLFLEKNGKEVMYKEFEILVEDK